MSLTYTTFTSQLANLLVIPTTDPNFLTFLPGCIDYAEQRIYRELNLLETIVRDTSSTATANNRTFNLPSSLGRFVAVSEINVVTPVATTTLTGTRNRVLPASLAYVDFLYPVETTTATSVPSRFAMVTDQQVVFGPAPSAAYQVEVVGTIRPTPLSVSNPTTYLTLYLPDLFMAAAMVFATGYQRDFGSQTDDPRMSQSWENQYQTLLKSATAEEVRKKYNEQFSAILAMPPTSGGVV